MYRIRFPIGDWSQDGHNQCDYYIVESNRSVEELRELHFRCIDELGFDIGDICKDYQQNYIRGDLLEKIKSLKIFDNAYDRFELEKDDKGELLCPGESFNVLEIWLQVYKFLDPRFEYSIEDLGLETIQFYGVDNKGRHLNVPGYGLFF